MTSQTERRLDPVLAGAIHDVLVEECGCSAHDRDNFLASTGIYGLTEYRFCGSLGFGGKVWGARPGSCYRPRFWVSCYREDETPERLKAIDAANLRLKALAP